MNKDKSDIKKVKNPSLKEGSTYRRMIRNLNFFRFFLTKKSSIIVVQMQLKAGGEEHIPVEVIGGSFKWCGGRYLVTDEYLTLNRTFKMQTAKYHEGICLPIKQVINELDIKKKLQQYKPKDLEDKTISSSDVINNIDPVILEHFVKSTVIQKVFAGAEMEDAFRFIKLMTIIGAIISAICLILLLKIAEVF